MMLHYKRHCFALESRWLWQLMCKKGRMDPRFRFKSHFSPHSYDYFCLCALIPDHLIQVGLRERGHSFLDNWLWLTNQMQFSLGFPVQRKNEPQQYMTWWLLWRQLRELLRNTRGPKTGDRWLSLFLQNFNKFLTRAKFTLWTMLLLYNIAQDQFWSVSGCWLVLDTADVHL